MAEELPDFRDYQIDQLVGARKREDLIKDNHGLFLIYFLIHSTSSDNKYTLSDEHVDYRYFSRQEVAKLEPRLNHVYGGLMDQVFNSRSKIVSEEDAIVF